MSGRAVVQAYQYALDPTPEQERTLRSHCGAQRYAFNWGLRLVRANLDQRAAERSYGITDAGLTPSSNWSAYGLRKTWNQRKDEVAPWWSENSKEAYSSGLANLASALRNWNDSRTGKRAGRVVRFPRFKSKRVAGSCRFSTGAFGLVEDDRRHVRLPRIGTVRTHESTRKLFRHLQRGTARVRSATVAHRLGRWQVSFSVEITRVDPAPTRPGEVVGIDLGVRYLAVLSTGETVPNPRPLETALPRLRRFRRRMSRRSGPDRRTGQLPSRRWLRARARISALHLMIRSGMLGNRGLARRVADVGMAEFRRQIEYKAAWSGVRVQRADRWFPSSRTCSGCGVVRTKLRLSERTFDCEHCGVVMDRDHNAARNLAALAGAQAADTSSLSRRATENGPAGNPRQTCIARATGNATGSPTRATRRREAMAQDTFSDVSRTVSE
ncbi:IS607 family element RNA-guided endonuclease TnpB [Crossiella cryophila]|uniref:Putative transposase n=1 Tax=Crossiella cryophila TaxID=43355 RepID=A0A7W7C7D0_9PSEU|nr:IS607 family element RNA-guided endonuclease TnpB [Crossiella cryophila]MBB4675895.1 putative transposase [Crossiella cryophila]